MLKTDFNEDRLGCSYATIMALANGTRYQAVKITGNLTKRKIVKKIVRTIPLNKNPKDITRTQSYRCADGSLVIESARTRRAFVKKSNVYLMKDSSIKAPSYHEKAVETK